MATILKIGYQEFLVRRSADAASVIKALADALGVESKYLENGRTVYWPSNRRRGAEISLRTVPASDILANDPGDADIPDETNGAREHGNGKPTARLNPPQRLLRY